MTTAFELALLGVKVLLAIFGWFEFGVIIFGPWLPKFCLVPKFFWPWKVFCPPGALCTWEGLWTAGFFGAVNCFGGPPGLGAKTFFCGAFAGALAFFFGWFGSTTWAENSIVAGAFLLASAGPDTTAIASAAATNFKFSLQDIGVSPLEPAFRQIQYNVLPVQWGLWRS